VTPKKKQKQNKNLHVETTNMKPHDIYQQNPTTNNG